MKFVFRLSVSLSFLILSIQCFCQAEYYNADLVVIQKIKDVPYIFNYSKDKYDVKSYEVEGNQVIEFYSKHNGDFCGAYFDDSKVSLGNLRFVKENLRLQKVLNENSKIQDLAKELNIPIMGMRYTDFMDLFLEPADITYGIQGDQQIMSFIFRQKKLVFRDQVLIDIQNTF